MKKSAFSLHDGGSLEVLARIFVWVNVFIVPDAAVHFLILISLRIESLHAIKESASVASTA